MTASNDRRTKSRHPLRRRLLHFLLGFALLAPGLAFQVPPPAVQANDLTDAIAEQQRIAKLIADQKNQLAKLNAQQASLQVQMATTKQNLVDVRTSIDESQTEITNLESTLVGVKARYDSLSAQQALLETRLAQLTNEQDAKQRELEVREQVLASRLVDAYVTDQTPLLQQILTAHSLTDALSQVSYYDSLSQADKTLADQIRSDQQTLAEIRQTVEIATTANSDMEGQVAAQKTQLDSEQAQLVADQQQLAALETELETQLAQQQAAEAKLAKNQAALDAAIRSNGQALDQLGAKIDQLVGQGNFAHIPSQYNGTLQWPMGGVITQEFGCTGVVSEPRVGSCAHFHQGIDIAAPCLTPIYAAGPGVVVFVGYNPYDAPPQAWLVIIAHSTSMVTWYAHMTPKAPPGIVVGAPVVAGELVGTENTTGHSTGCHLHWAVRVNGSFMNPRLFV
jgi:murein DD-endopeptidase MepM/ murein hydrolase activator NlpD